MKKKLEKKKGITLIALVVTIIILLILAGVSIAMLTGPNGLLTQARNAADLTEQAQKEEENMLDELSVMMEGGNATKVTDKTPGILDGDGSEGKPYLIESIEDLASFSEEVNGGKDYNGKIVKLEVNLDFNKDISYIEPENLKEKLTKGKGFTPIGTELNKFNGIFDGKGHTLRNLYISVEGDNNIGLFGYTDTNSNIKNIILSNVNITSQGNNVGGIVGENNGTIEKANIESGNIVGNTDVGGIAGWNTGKIIECTNGGKIKGLEFIGGIAGYNMNSQINLCTNNGEIVGDGILNTGDKLYHAVVGGIAGRANNSSIRDCMNDGKVWGSIGGICGGIIINSSVEKCYNNGEIGILKKEADECNVGGICGDVATNSNVSRSYNTGEIYGCVAVAGIVGLLGHESSATIDNCYNIGKITGSYGSVAGIAFVTRAVVDCEIRNS